MGLWRRLRRPCPEQGRDQSCTHSHTHSLTHTTRTRMHMHTQIRIKMFRDGGRKNINADTVCSFVQSTVLPHTLLSTDSARYYKMNHPRLQHLHLRRVKCNHKKRERIKKELQTKQKELELKLVEFEKVKKSLDLKKKELENDCARSSRKRRARQKPINQQIFLCLS